MKNRTTKAAVKNKGNKTLAANLTKFLKKSTKGEKIVSEYKDKVKGDGRTLAKKNADSKTKGQNK